MPKTQKTERLVLRALVIADAPWITRAVNLPDIHRNVARIRPGQSQSETEDYIKRCAEGELADTDYVWMIEFEDERVGIIGLHRSSRRDPFELGYWLHPDFWSKGIITEAARCVVRWADEHITPKLLVSGHYTDNPYSGQILKKIGFLPCWRQPVYCAGRDEKVDHLYMSRLSD